MTNRTLSAPDHGAQRRINGQNGSVFLIALILLSILTILGVTAAKNTSMEEGMVRNTRDRQLAFQAAEAALSAGERLIASYHPTFDSNCTSGFCTQGCPTNPRWTDATLNVWNDPTKHQIYPVQLNGVLTVPNFIIEDVCAYGSPSWRSSNPGWSVATLPQRLYRVTARGTGGTNDSLVMLQSTYAVTRVVDPTCVSCGVASLPGVTTTAVTTSVTTTTTSVSTTTTSVSTTTTSVPTTTTSVSTTTTSVPTTTTSAATTTTSVPTTTTSVTATTTSVGSTTTSIYNNCKCYKFSSTEGKRSGSSGSYTRPACCTNTLCNSSKPSNFSSLATNDTYWITCQ